MNIQPMTKAGAEEIAHWAYDPPYDFYNMEGESAIIELLEENYYEVRDREGDVIGFFCLGPAGRVPHDDMADLYTDTRFTDIGIGMRPNRTGQGAGTAFFQTILSYCERRLDIVDFRLAVASFNERAIHLYEKLGFEKVGSFDKSHSTGFTNFQIMIRDLGRRADQERSQKQWLWFLVVIVLFAIAGWIFKDIIDFSLFASGLLTGVNL